MDLSEALSRARVLYAKLCRSVQAYGEEAEYHYENVLGGDVCEHEEDSGYHISYNYEMMQASDEHAIDQQSFALQIKQRVHNLERLAYERESLLEEKKTLRLVYYIHCQVDCHTMTSTNLADFRHKYDEDHRAEIDENFTAPVWLIDFNTESPRF